VREFDQDAVTEEAQARTKAQLAAKAGNDGVTLNQVAAIQACYVKELNDLSSECATQMRAHQRLLDEFDEIDPDKIFGQNTNQTQSELEQRNSEKHAERDDLLTQRRGAFVDFNTFKEEHGLIRGVKEDQSGLMHLAIFASVWLLETLINAMFFGQTNDQGLVGGAFEAGIFSLINLALAAAVGRGFKYKNHISIGLRFFGWAVITAGLTVLTLWNCLIGHYRNALGEALRAQSDEAFARATEIALKNWSQNPFAVTDFESAALICLGLLLAVAAIVKEYSYRDRYPGYSDCHDEYEGRQDDLRDFREDEERPSLIKIYTDAVDRLESRKVELKTNVNSYREAIRGIEEERKAFNDQNQVGKNHFNATLLEFKSSFQSMSASALPDTINIEELVEALESAIPLPEINLDVYRKKAVAIEETLEAFNKRLANETSKIMSEQKKSSQALAEEHKKQDELFIINANQ